MSEKNGVIGEDSANDLSSTDNKSGIDYSDDFDAFMKELDPHGFLNTEEVKLGFYQDSDVSSGSTGISKTNNPKMQLDNQPKSYIAGFTNETFREQEESAQVNNLVKEAENQTSEVKIAAGNTSENNISADSYNNKRKRNDYIIEDKGNKKRKGKKPVKDDTNEDTKVIEKSKPTRGKSHYYQLLDELNYISEKDDVSKINNHLREFLERKIKERLINCSTNDYNFLYNVFLGTRTYILEAFKINEIFLHKNEDDFLAGCYILTDKNNTGVDFSDDIKYRIVNKSSKRK